MYNQKDIVLIPFPYSDLTTLKQRPALIISNNKINKMQDRICCLITTNPHKNDLLITIDSFQQGELPFKSWLKPHRIFTIHEKIIRKKLCTINNDLFDRVIKQVNDCIKRD